MRLNGTYLDRLLINILPVIFIAFIAVFFIKETSLKSNFFVGSFLITLLWAVDSYVIYKRNPKSFRLDNELLLFDYIVVIPRNVLDIRKITYKPGRFWTWEYFAFTIKLGNDIKIINVIERPQFLIETILGKKSKTLTPLFERFPELMDKYTHHTTLNSFR